MINRTDTRNPNVPPAEWPYRRLGVKDAIYLDQPKSSLSAPVAPEYQTGEAGATNLPTIIRGALRDPLGLIVIASIIGGAIFLFGAVA